MKTKKTNRRGHYLNFNEEDFRISNELKNKHFLNVGLFLKQCLRDKYDELEGKKK